MLGADIIKAIVDKDLVDKEIVVIGTANDADDIEGEGSQIEAIHLLEEQGTGVLTFEGYIEQ